MNTNLTPFVLPWCGLSVVLLALTVPAHAQVSSCLGQPNGTLCDGDGNPCTAGTCFFGTCFSEGPLPDGSGCNDGNPCTVSSQCSGGTCSVHVNAEDGSLCPSDGAFCTGVEACSSGACVSPGDPCTSPSGAGSCGVICDEADDVCAPVDPWGVSLTVARSTAVPGDLELSWSPDCLPGADYAVYEGTLGDFTSHVPVGSATCTTGGATATTLTPAAVDGYYLVVPLDPPGGTEGSYGFASDGTPRPPSLTPCRDLSVCECSADD